MIISLAVVKVAPSAKPCTPSQIYSAVTARSEHESLTLPLDPNHRYIAEDKSQLFNITQH